MSTSNYTVSGLSTGMDTQSIIDNLVTLRQAPLTTLQNQETAVKAQVSALGTIVSKLSSLQSAAQALSTGGALGVSATSSNTAFTATPGSGAIAGTYSVTVNGLASAAKARSVAFGSGDVVSGGSLQLTVDGKSYTTSAWADGASLGDVVDAIRATGAPVSAVVLNDGTNSYLSVTKTATGYTPGTDPASALTFTEKTTGSAGKALGLASTATPQNASFTIDGVTFTRSSNTVSDALPGTTLNLKAKGGPEDLTLANDLTATQAKLQTFVDAYNGIMKLVQAQTNVNAATNRANTLAGDATLRSLQDAMQAIGSTIARSGGVRSLADLGIATQQDGTLTINADTLAAAVARDPTGVNAVFSDPTSGVAKLASSLVDSYTDPVNGLLIVRQNGLNDQIHDMDDQANQLQEQLDSYRQSLVNQFAAMETVVGQYKSIGTYLTQQSNAKSSSSS